MVSQTTINDILSWLRRRYGPCDRLAPDTPFALVLFENASYLVDDERRAATFRNLEISVGVSPHAIIAADDDALREALSRGGPMLERRMQKVRAAGELAAAEFDGNLDHAIKARPDAAEKFLRKFPSIGEPGAAKIVVCRDKAVSGARFERRAGSAASGFCARAAGLRDELPFIDPGVGT